MDPAVPILLVAAAGGNDAALGVIPTLVKAGAIGFAFFAAFLGYRLLDSGKRRGWAFLAFTLPASFVFLGAELYVMSQGAKREISVTRFPNTLDRSMPLTISINRTPLEFTGGVERHLCDGPSDLTINAEALIEELKEARRRELSAMTATVRQTEAFSGFANDEGGPM